MIMERLDQPKWEEYQCLFFDANQNHAPGTLCICEKCVSSEAYLPGDECPVCLADNGIPSIATTLIHRSHSCAMCAKPVHGGCCVYVARNGDGQEDGCKLPKMWDTAPTCAVCYGEAQKNTDTYQRWLQPEIAIGSEIQFPFPIAVAKLRQVVGLDLVNPNNYIATNISNVDPWFTNGLFESFGPFQTKTTDFHMLDTVGPIETSPTDAVTIEPRVVYTAKVGRADIERLCSPNVECTPSMAELWIAVLANFITKQKNLKGGERSTILPMGFTSELFRAVKMPANATDETGDFIIRFYKANSWWMQSVLGKAYVVLPFIHEVVHDYGIIIIPPFEGKDGTIEITVLEYCENSLFCQNRYNVFVKRGIEQFFRAMWPFRFQGLLFPKINFNRIMRATNRSWSTVEKASPFTDGGFSLCYDLRTLVGNKGGPRRCLDGIARVVWECPSDETSKKRFQQTILCLRTMFLTQYLGKIAQTLNSSINVRFHHFSKDHLQVAKELFKSLFLPVDGQGGNLTIEVLRETDYSPFLIALRACLAYEAKIADLYKDDCFTLFSEENVPSLEQEPRIYLSKVSIDIPNPKCFDKWLGLMDMTPAEVLFEANGLVKGLLTSLEIPLCFGANQFHDIEQLMAANATVRKAVSGTDDNNSGIDDNKNPGIIKMCSLELTFAIVFLELFNVSIISPPGSMLLYCTNVAINCHINDNSARVEISEGTDRMICLVYDAEIHHYGVFEILLKEKQVVVYDGEDGTPFLAKEKNGNRLYQPPEGSVKRDAADRAWSEMASQLLFMLGQIDEPNVALLTIASNHLNATTAGWRVVPVVLYRENDWKSHLIRQIDGYSCGYIAILHIMKLMGQSISTHFDNDQEKCVPQDPCQTMAGVLKTFKMKEAIGNWFAKYVGDPSKVTNSEFCEYYCCGHHAASGDAKEKGISGEEAELATIGTQIGFVRELNEANVTEGTSAPVPVSTSKLSTCNGMQEKPISTESVEVLAIETQTSFGETEKTSAPVSIPQMPDRNGKAQIVRQNENRISTLSAEVGAMVGTPTKTLESIAALKPTALDVGDESEIENPGTERAKSPSTNDLIR
jgi:hypothetical protein